MTRAAVCPDQRQARILAAYARHPSVKAVAAVTGHGQNTVRRIVREAGLTVAPAKPRMIGEPKRTDETQDDLVKDDARLGSQRLLERIVTYHRRYHPGTPVARLAV